MKIHDNDFERWGAYVFRLGMHVVGLARMLLLHACYQKPVQKNSKQAWFRMPAPGKPCIQAFLRAACVVTGPNQTRVNARRNRLRVTGPMPVFTAISRHAYPRCRDQAVISSTGFLAIGAVRAFPHTSHRMPCLNRSEDT